MTTPSYGGPDLLSDMKARVAAAGYWAHMARGLTLDQAHAEMVTELETLWPDDAAYIAGLCKLAFMPCVGMC